MTRPLRVMLVAAEASGDALGASLARALKRRLGERVEFTGVGGTQMAGEGIKSPFDIAELSILGLFEGLFALRRVLRRADETKALAAREKPDVAVLIDSWGFTLRVAQRLKALDPNLLVIKYVAPQVWASRPGRAKTLARTVDHLLAMHVFDAPYFEAVGLPTTFVGNAALHTDFTGADPARLRARIDATPDEPILLVAPGSRPSEIARVLPPFEAAVNRLKDRWPSLKVAVLAAPTVAETVRTAVAGWPHRAHVIKGEEGKRDAMKAATVALACSGTVTTELGMAGCPMVVGYRIGAMTYAIIKRLIRTPYLVLMNIAAQDFVVPELVQDACTGEALAGEAAILLESAALRTRQIERQDAALDLMGRGGPDPSEAAADAILVLAAERGLAA